MIKLNNFRFSIDRGGTFTDIYAEIPNTPGFKVIKLLSEDPNHYPDAPREGIRRILEEYAKNHIVNNKIKTESIDWIRMGTTVATNALLERKGSRTALLITKGFKDVLQIGNQERPELFDLKISKPELLYEEVIEVDERIRILKDGEQLIDKNVVHGITGEKFVILQAIDIEKLAPKIRKLKESGISSLAIVFIHAYAWPDHEKAAALLAREIGFTNISLSSSVMPSIKLVSRGDTTMVDAYLTPVIKKYLKSFRNGFSGDLKEKQLLLMQSNGGLIKADDFSGSKGILSGPAGGVVGFAKTTFNPKTKQPVIGFDMGGTSTDVSRFDGNFEMVHETKMADVRIQAPQLNIKTVAAGGGSRLFFENGMFLVGPESSGADPGPVCYRKNGFLSITDANLILGRIQPDYFPKIFGPNHNLSPDLDASKKAMEKLLEKINDYNISKKIKVMSIEEAALGFINVANEVMVRPIRELSIMRGYDIQNHILSTFGGAGPQHACAIARILGISKIFIHRFSGVLSAYGMGLADVVIEKKLPASEKFSTNKLTIIIEKTKKLFISAEKELIEQGFNKTDILSKTYLNLRFDGTTTAIMIPEPHDQDYEKSFRAAHNREFGFDFDNREIMLDDIRVVVTGKTKTLKKFPIPVSNKKPKPANYVSSYFENGWKKTSVYYLDKLKAEQKINGPAIIIHDTSTILIEPECQAQITEFGDVEIEVEKKQTPFIKATVNPIQLSIFSNLFISIAEQMGRMLEKTSVSANIKERRDFSCALFDANGELVANAPHLPVHLGAMSEAVKAQIRIHGDNIKKGDALVSNHPIAGGSHLPDITVITPVFFENQIIFWTASRGHHADVGGITPGSMPPDSKCLDEEGICIESFKILEKGIFQEKKLFELLVAHDKKNIKHKKTNISGCRNPSDNISDLKAQIAANQKGIELVLEMINSYSLKTVLAYMEHIRHSAENAVRSSLKKLSKYKGLKERDNLEAIDYLDDGTPIVLKITIDNKNGSATFDFTGTGSELKGNLNTPIAVTKSAILYSLRCLIEKDLPLNDGCLIPIKIIIPSGSLLDASSKAAVVGGNVLTSQRIVDVILKAFGVVAASQGCMNNLTFGNDNFGYYETIGGGAGAGPDWNGQSGVHTHMTNTRITDPEILEQNFPVILRKFSLRKHSGGKGKFKGGNGLIRELEFLVPLKTAILSERRVYSPYGLEGGQNGKKGKNFFINKFRTIYNIGGKNEISVTPGDRIRILTPGGGGFGKEES